MSHTCTWNANYANWMTQPGRTCGATATKFVVIRSRHKTYKVVDKDGAITEHESEGRIIWLCDEHYNSPDPWEMWDQGGGIVEA